MQRTNSFLQPFPDTRSVKGGRETNIPCWMVPFVLNRIKINGLSIFSVLQGIFVSLESEAALDRHTDKIAYQQVGQTALSSGPPAFRRGRGVWGQRPH